jgi:stage II sporulation protein M
MKQVIYNTLREERIYLWRIRAYVWFALILFLLSVLSGALYAHYFPTETAAYMEQLQSFFSTIAKQTPWQTFLSIFGNNLNAMFTVVAMGLFAGLFAFVFLVVNGFLLGMVGQLFLQKAALLVFFAGIVPHGIIEIPCMLFAAAIGLRIGATAITRLFGKSGGLIEEVALGLKFVTLILMPALALAALIETYITPLFITAAQSIIGA